MYLKMKNISTYFQHMIIFKNFGPHTEHRNKISNVDNTNPYEIRPVITINNNILYTEGDGTITNPYKIGVSTLSLGSKVSKDNDKYIVIDATNNYKLLSEKVIENITYDEVNDYLNNLINYKNIIEKITIKL